MEENKLDTSEIKEAIIQPIIKEKTAIPIIIEKEEICKILSMATNKISVDFKGFGIEIPITEDIEIDNQKEVKVFYTSNIGKADFKYHLKVK